MIDLRDSIIDRYEEVDPDITGRHRERSLPRLQSQLTAQLANLPTD